MDAADHQHGRVDRGGAARHRERVRDDVREILDLGPLIVVRQDGGAARPLELAELGDEIRCLQGGGHDAQNTIKT
jgi:hypothetical protein